MKRNSAWITAFLLLTISGSFAQDLPWIINVHTAPGFDLYLEELWYVEIMNPSDREREIVLAGEVHEEREGLMFHGFSNPIMVFPGGRMITPQDITEIRDKWFHAEFRSSIERTGRFPAGLYNICITVIDIMENQPLGRNCTFFHVTRPSAPRLIEPQDQGELTEPYPIFQWDTPVPIPQDAEVFYHIRIYEIRPGQSAYEAVENIVHYEGDFFGTQFQYPLDALRLEEGKEYVWQVQCLQRLGRPIGENDGRSEIWRFRYQPPVIAKIQVPSPDTLLIGGFRLVVDKNSVSASDQKLSGQAYGQLLTPPPCSGDSSLSVADELTIPGPQIMSATDFTVTFTDLELEHWPPGQTEKVTKGRIKQAFTSPLYVMLNDFKVYLQKITMNTDSSFADLKIEIPPAYLYKPGSCKPYSIEIDSVRLNQRVHFYHHYSSFAEDSVIIGNTGIKTALKGATFSFKRSIKVITFDSGQTIPKKSDYNNTAFLSAAYTFTDGQLIGCEGFKADLTLKSALSYLTLIPADFNMSLQSGQISIRKSRVEKGKFAGQVQLPQTVTDAKKNPLSATFTDLQLDSTLDLSGTVTFTKNTKISWSNFHLTTGQGRLYLPAAGSEWSYGALDTATVTKYTMLQDSYIYSKIAKLPGISMFLGGQTLSDSFVVKSLDCKKPLTFPFNQSKIGIKGWVNIETKGILGEIQSFRKVDPVMTASYGITDSSKYKAKKPFSATICHEPDSLWVDFQFIRNAVYESNISGRLNIPYPCGIKANYKNLELTSTAEMVGGEVFFKAKKLKYWGVKMTAAKTGNILSVDTGEIIYMNSYITEDVHFAKPFRIIWGEMLADGGLGRFLFDYNCPGQKFDGFPLLVHNVALSKYHKKTTSTALDTLGHLRAYGDLSFDFFGTKRMDIRDARDSTATHDQAPYYERFVSLNKKNCNLHFDKTWGSDRAHMVFDVDYDNDLKTGDQYGFLGVKSKTMKVDIDLAVAGTSLNQTLTPTTIDLNSRTSYIQFCKSGALTVLSGGADMDNIGGLIQIKGDTLKRIYLEGQVSIKEWEFESNSLASLEITPNNITMSYKGQVTFDLYGVGLLGMVGTRFVLNTSQVSLEGDISGAFRVYFGGTNLAEIYTSSSYLNIEAAGRLNFYLSPTVNYVQGYAKVKLKVGYIQPECEGAFFVGYKAPPNKIWVLDTITRGPSIRDKLSGKSSLTGCYFAGLFSYTVDITIVSAGIQMWAGMGFFADNAAVTFIGHGGVEVHGKLLGGLVSGSAWAELYNQFDIGASDFYMCLQGTLGLEICALVVFCVPMEIDFYVDTDTGFALGSCKND